ncbi:MAG: hypothetical protein WC881_00750 [Elusimicrobiota bacterium]|jgi:Flp pilus assembly protein protease CpaA
MSLLRAALFGFFAVLSAVISWKDWHNSCIPNRLLLLGAQILSLGLAIYGGHSLLAHFGWPHIPKAAFPLNFYTALLQHAGICMAASIALWWWGLWPAGDAKLFALAATFAAVLGPDQKGFPHWLCLRMLGNIFVPAAIVYLIGEGYGAIINLKKNGPKKNWSDHALLLKESAVRGYENRKEYAVLFINIICVFLLMQALSNRLNSSMRWLLDGRVISAGLFFAWASVGPAMIRLRLWAALPVIVYIAGGAMLFPDLLLRELHGAVRAGVIFSLVLGIGRNCLSGYLDRKNGMLIPIGELRPGMIVAEADIQKIRCASPFRSRFDRIYPDGLTWAQVHGFQETAKMFPIDTRVGIIKPAAFGPWILAGIWMSLLWKNDCLSIIRRIYE